MNPYAPLRARRQRVGRNDCRWLSAAVRQAKNSVDLSAATVVRMRLRSSIYRHAKLNPKVEIRIPAVAPG